MNNATPDLMQLLRGISSISAQAECLVSQVEAVRRMVGALRAEAVPAFQAHTHPARPAPKSTTYEIRGTSLLVPLHPGTEKPPVYCPHVSDGMISGYLELAKHLGAGRAVVGLQAIGMIGKETPPGTIEDIAERFCREIDAQQPDGPYNVVGWSFGGMIAFEMAHRWRARGADVCLCLIDTTHPSVLRERLSTKQGWVGFAQDLVKGAHFTDLPLDGEEEPASTVGESFRRLFAKIDDSGYLDRPDKQYLKRPWRILKAVSLAGYEYRPAYYPGRVVFLQAKHGLFGVGVGEEHLGYCLGWRGAAESMQRLEIPGNHRTMMMPPNASVIAEQIRPFLLETASRSTAARAQAVNDVSVPVLPDQERLWYRHHIHSRPSALHVRGTVSLPGAVDASRLRRVINQVCREQPALRTRFEERGGALRQLIAAQCEVPFETADLSNSPDVGRALHEQSRRLLEQPFDLSRAPLVRAGLFRLSAEEQVLCVVMHRIVADGMSARIFIRDLQRDLSPRAESRTPADAGYVSVISAIDARNRTTDQAKAREFWKSKVGGARPIHDLLAIDGPRQNESSHRAACHRFELPAELGHRVRSWETGQHTTLHSLLLATFQLLVSRCTGARRFLTVVPIDRRVDAPEQGPACIGSFSVPTLIRSDIADDATFAAGVRSVDGEMMEALTHRGFPFGEMARLVEPPQLSVMFDFTKNLEPIDEPFNGRDIEFDLQCSITQHDNTFSGRLEYNPDILNSDTAAEMAISFVGLLDRVTREPDVSMSALQLSAALARKTVARAQQQQIGIAATFTIEPIEDTLKFWLDVWDVAAEVRFAPYNQVFQQLLSPASDLLSTNNLLNVLFIRPEDWIDFQTGSADRDVLDTRLKASIRDFVDALRRATQRTSAPFVVGICPASRSEDFVHAAEQQLFAALSTMPNVHPIAADEWLRHYSVDHVLDAHAARVGRIPYTAEFFTVLGTVAMRRFIKLTLPQYKVIALDCDHTLWNGVIEEDGVHGVKLDPPYAFMHRFMASQHDSGMLLCLCSKNKPDSVAEFFASRSDTILRRDHIVAERINWEAKSRNLASLASQLNLGVDSFVFLDDSPVECAEVRANAPQVLTLQIPDDPRRIPQFLQHVWVFDVLTRTAEDRTRTHLYRQNLERDEYRRQSSGYQEFLAGLQLRVAIDELSDATLPRAAQLTQRTNQFNFTTTRRTERELAALCASGHVKAWTVSVSDRFGDYGLVGLMLARVDAVLDVDTFLLSCRVLGRGVEHRMLAHLGEIARQHRLGEVHLQFRRTAKNEPAHLFLRGLTATESGPVFRMAAGVAAAARIDESAAPAPPVTEGEDVPQQTMASSALLQQKLEHVAAHLYDVDSIQAAIAKKFTRSSSHRATVLPSTPTEQALAEIWQGLLHIEPIGLHDNFFDIGGHSVLAAQLLAKVANRFGTAIDLSAFLDASTIATMAQVIDQGPKAPRQAVSLERDVFLDVPALRRPLVATASEPRHILLTGATGFLGGYLLRDLIEHTAATIHCLVRAEDSARATEKIRRHLESQDLWQERFHDRIVTVVGDLSRPLLGLSEETYNQLGELVDGIYHNGADVNFIYPYEKLRTANVDSTRTLLQLAFAGSVKPFHFVSSLGVHNGAEFRKKERIFESDRVVDGAALEMGYLQSKWVAEHLVELARDRGCPATIYRPCSIFGDTKTGRFPSADAVYRVLTTAFSMGKLPSLEGRIQFVPVDFASRAIVAISKDRSGWGRNYHVLHPTLIPLADIVTWAASRGFPLQVVPNDEWMDALVRIMTPEHPLFPFLSMLSASIGQQRTVPHETTATVSIDCTNTLSVLERENIPLPPVDAQLFDTYFGPLLAERAV